MTVKRKKKKKGILKQSMSLAFLVMGVVILGTYIGFCVYFHSHFFNRTQIEDIAVGGMTAEEAAEAISNEVSDYLLTVSDRDGNKYQILGVDFDYQYEPKGEEEHLIDEQNVFLWPFRLNKTKLINMEKSISFDQDKLLQQVDGMECFLPEHMIKPTDAYIVCGEEGYELIPEQQGSYLIKDKVAALITDAVDSGLTELKLPDDVYEKPEVTQKDPKLTECMDKINAFFGARIQYDIQGADEVVDQSVISQWITVDDNYQVTFDEGKVADYVQQLAYKYNTYGDEREFKTTMGGTVTIGGGDYGWVIDKEAEAAQLMEEVKNGEVITREPNYSQRAVVSGLEDIGDTYLEIDYTNQHLYYYEQGELQMDTDIVSGNISRGNGSPDGVFKIVYKKSPAVLKGEDYESNVDYFMVFAYNVGVHDASWRHGKFGGQIYKTSGSHGCINVSEEAAAKLYSMIEKDTPVIAYYREEVQLTAENTKISNAYSYYDEEKEKAKQEALAQQNTVQLAENQRIEEDGNIVTE